VASLGLGHCACPPPPVFEKFYKLLAERLIVHIQVSRPVDKQVHFRRRGLYAVRQIPNTPFTPNEVSPEEWICTGWGVTNFKVCVILTFTRSVQLEANFLVCISNTVDGGEGESESSIFVTSPPAFHVRQLRWDDRDVIVLPGGIYPLGIPPTFMSCYFTYMVKVHRKDVLRLKTSTFCVRPPQNRYGRGYRKSFPHVNRRRSHR